MGVYKDNRLSFTVMILMIIIAFIWIVEMFFRTGNFGIFIYPLFFLYTITEVLTAMTVIFLLEPLIKKYYLSSNPELIKAISAKETTNISLMIVKGLNYILIFSYCIKKLSDIINRKINIPSIDLIGFIILCLIVIFALIKACFNISIIIPTAYEFFDATVNPKCYMLNDSMYILIYKNLEYKWLMKEHSLIYLYSCTGWVNQVMEVTTDFDARESEPGVYAISKNFAILSPETRSIIYYNQTNIDDDSVRILLSDQDYLIKKGNVIYFFKVPGKRYKIVAYHYMLENEIINAKDYGIYIIPINCALYNEGNNTWVHINDDFNWLDGDVYKDTPDGRVLIKVSKRIYKVILIDDLTMRRENDPIVLDSNNVACYKCERIDPGLIRNYYFYLNDSHRWLESEVEFKDLFEEDGFLFLYKRKQCSLTIVKRRDISLDSLPTNVNGLFYITSESNIAAVYKADGGLKAYIHQGNKYIDYDTSLGIIYSKPTDSFLFIQSGREISSFERNVNIHIGTDASIKLTIHISITRGCDMPEVISDSSVITINNLLGLINGSISKESLEKDCINEVLELINHNTEINAKVQDCINQMLSIYYEIYLMPTNTRQDINKIQIYKGERISRIENLRNNIQTIVNNSLKPIRYKIFDIEPKFTDTVIDIPAFDFIMERIEKITPSSLTDEISELTEMFRENGTDMNIVASLIKSMFGQSMLEDNSLLGVKYYIDNKIINCNYENSIFIYQGSELSYDDMMRIYNEYVTENGNIKIEEFLSLNQIKVLEDK